MQKDKIIIAFKFDEDGEYLHPVEHIENEHLDSNLTLINPFSEILYKPKWDGVKWVEGETEQEREKRETQQLLESLNPSPSELADSELEIKVLTLLMEMEVI